VQHHRAKTTAPIESYYRGNLRTTIKAKDATDMLRHIRVVNYSKTGIHASENSTRSLHAGDAMAMLCGGIDMDSICMMGIWNRDAMLRYLHIQAQPIIYSYAARMFNHGTYTFLPDETFPIIDVNIDD
jgi:hypothetical protein